MKSKRKNPIKKTKAPSYIGIDFSILSPGISISANDQITTHVFDFSKTGETKTDRWHHVTEYVLHFILRRVEVSECFIMLEDYASGGKGRTNDIAECCGILKWKLAASGCSMQDHVRLVSVQHVKQFIADKGSATKEMMIKEVYKRYGFDTDDNNAADAYGIMKICRAFHLPPEIEKVTAFQKGIISKIREYNEKNWYA